MQSIKSLAAKLFAKYVDIKIRNWAKQPKKTQEKVLKKLVQTARNTKFGKDHHFDSIKDYKDFCKKVPIRDYEQLRPYVDEVVAGKADVLWPGKPLYFAKTSGTTSGVKYIPLTKSSIPYHIQAARNAILCYISETGRTKFVNGKMIFLQGNPKLDSKNGIHLGRLSGIVAHYVPNYLQKNRMPSWETNCILDWEQKVDAIVEETKDQNMTVFGGIPPWLQMYFEKLQTKTSKTIGELFPNLELLIYGGVNYEPYRATFDRLFGKKVAGIELYPASEGFFAFQDRQEQSGMLLQLNSGIFYEFVEAQHFFDKNPKRIAIDSIVEGVNYVMLISTNAGLWAYNIGDIVMFTSTAPYRLVVTGRIKHFISAFGEHVIGKEVDEAMAKGIQELGVQIHEFTVAPQVNPPDSGLPYHQWFIEFEKTPKNLDKFAQTLDRALRTQNTYYNDLIQNKILKHLQITVVPKNGFRNYMKSKGKLGGQNKLPRLSNDRNIAEELEEILQL